MEVYAYPPALPRQGINLDIRDITLNAALELYQSPGEVKERLYYPLFQIKRSLDEFLLRRPDLGYALEPLTPNGDEPDFVQELIKVGQRFSIGPIAALEGAMADLAIATLKGLGRDITVACGRVIVVDYRRPLIIPEAQGEWGGEIPPKTMAAALGNDIMVAATSGAAAAAALAWGEREITAGAETKEITAALLKYKEIRGGLIRTAAQVQGWGGMIPIFIREVEK